MDADVRMSLRSSIGGGEISATAISEWLLVTTVTSCGQSVFDIAQIDPTNNGASLVFISAIAKDIIGRPS